METGNHLAGEAVAKPLEWMECKAFGGGKKLIAKDCFGNEYARLDLVGQSEEYIASFKTLWQGYYETRIRSALAVPPSIPAGGVRETLDLDALAETVANIRQGQRDTPRCEPPGPYDIELARKWVDWVLDALSLPAGGVAVSDAATAYRAWSSLIDARDRLEAALSPEAETGERQ